MLPPPPPPPSPSPPPPPPARTVYSCLLLPLTPFPSCSHHLLLPCPSLMSQLPLTPSLRYPMQCPPGVRAEFKNEIDALEHLEPTGFGILQTFGRPFFFPYRILPSFARVQQRGYRKKVLIDCGAGGFRRGGKYLVDLYAPWLSFDDLILVEPFDDIQVMERYRSRHNITVLREQVRVVGGGGGGGGVDILSLLEANVKEEDFVVLKFDCDDNGESAGTGTIEWGFLAALLYSPQLSLVDELFIELHFFFPQLWQASFLPHSMWQAFDALRQIRACGVAVHVWP
eukprot:747549-Hanusia_phi.AAC.2